MPTEERMELKRSIVNIFKSSPDLGFGRGGMVVDRGAAWGCL